jgi:hypothetical protein
MFSVLLSVLCGPFVIVRANPSTIFPLDIGALVGEWY